MFFINMKKIEKYLWSINIHKRHIQKDAQVYSFLSALKMLPTITGEKDMNENRIK